MSGFKDLFSGSSPDYARFRPTYPAALFDYLAAEAPGRGLAWDVGTGSGQAARALAERFERVVATDPAANQIAAATAHPRIDYRVEPAERSSLPGDAVDLVTVAQAFHWFRADAFFAEVSRVLRPGGILAFWCYGLARITPEVDAAVQRLYEDILGPYWEPERRLVETGYRGIELPFPETEPPPFAMEAEWSVEDLQGYLGTWSALRTYVARHGADPLAEAAEAIRSAWGGAPRRRVSWVVSVRTARKPSSGTPPK